jgi:hypothetical protein
MLDYETTDWCTHCKRVTVNRGNYRGAVGMVFICLDCGRFTDAVYDDEDEDVCSGCGEYEGECECTDEEM